MVLMPGESADIDRINDKFFDKLNYHLTNLGYSPLDFKFKTVIKGAFIHDILQVSDDNPGIMKNDMEGIVFHKTANIVKAYAYYAQARYNFFLRFGWMLFHFFKNPDLHPRVECKNGVYFVADPGKSTSKILLSDYFKNCKEGKIKYEDGVCYVVYPSIKGTCKILLSRYFKECNKGKSQKEKIVLISGRDFLECNILNKFNLNVIPDYNLPLEYIYYSYYISDSDPGVFSIREEFDIIKLGTKFLQGIMTKNLDVMFINAHKKEKEYHREPEHKDEYYEENQYFDACTDEYYNNMMTIFFANPGSGRGFIDLYNLIQKVKRWYYKTQSKFFFPKTLRDIFIDIVQGTGAKISKAEEMGCKLKYVWPIFF
jgi:hypothetical protein